MERLSYGALFGALNDSGARYVIVGGLAGSGLHGLERGPAPGAGCRSTPPAA